MPGRVQPPLGIEGTCQTYPRLHVIGIDFECLFILFRGRVCVSGEIVDHPKHNMRLRRLRIEPQHRFRIAPGVIEKRETQVDIGGQLVCVSVLRLVRYFLDSLDSFQVFPRTEHRSAQRPLQVQIVAVRFFQRLENREGLADQAELDLAFAEQRADPQISGIFFVKCGKVRRCCREVALLVIS